VAELEYASQKIYAKITGSIPVSDYKEVFAAVPLVENESSILKMRL
jgi:hypothetical protein